MCELRWKERKITGSTYAAETKTLKIRRGMGFMFACSQQNYPCDPVFPRRASLILVFPETPGRGSNSGIEIKSYISSSCLNTFPGEMGPGAPL